jgi:galactose oxidase
VFEPAAEPGSLIMVMSTQPQSMVSMVRMSAETHSTNTDQRRLELCGPHSSPCTGTGTMVVIPGEGIAIPGYWMVFAMNEQGVPSVAVPLLIT